MTVAASAHPMFKVVRVDEGRPIHAGKLRALADPDFNITCLRTPRNGRSHSKIGLSDLVIRYRFDYLNIIKVLLNKQIYKFPSLPMEKYTGGVDMGNRYKHCALWAGVALNAVAAAPAIAQSAGDNAGGDIIVTARRVEERLQDVPISITVFSQEQISNRNIVTATDLGAYTPSLTVNQRFGPEKASFVIRGFVQENATAPSVGSYFAEVSAIRAQGGTQTGNILPVGSFMDLQNVQVLKGPQGTLFGRNTTGGAVLVVPQKPTNRLEGYIEGSLGDYNLQRIQGAINIPLADTFKIRFTAERNKREGYMKNKSGIGPDNYNDVNYFAARLSIVADLTPNLENYTVATYAHSFSNGYGTRIVYCDPVYAASLASGASYLITSTTEAARALNGLSACDQLNRQRSRGDGLLDIDISNPDSGIDIHQWQVINTTTWQVSDNLRVRNIASYGELKERDSFSLNGDNFRVVTPAPTLTPAVAAGLGFGTNTAPFPAGAPWAYVQPHVSPESSSVHQLMYTDELQVQGTAADGRLDYQFGGYMEISRPMGSSGGYSANLLNCSNVVRLDCTNPIGLGSIQNSFRKSYFDNHGLYAQATYKLTEQLAVTGGIRYTWDKVRSITADTRIRLVPGGGITRTCNDIVRFGRNTVPDRSACLLHLEQKSSAPTWLIDIDYKPIPDVLLYAKWARGYRQGGVNPTNINLEIWGPEKVDTYELGAKASFGGAVRGYFNLAGFYNDFRNQQLNVSAISNGTVPGFSGTQPVVNAGKSRIWGIEVDASATFFDSLRADVGYSYLNTKLLEISLPPVPNPGPYDRLVPSALPGNQLALSPKHRLTLTGTYTLPVPDSVGEMSIGATFVYTASQVFTLATAPQFQRLPSSSVLNLNANWNNVLGQSIDLAAFVTNVTNEIYPVTVGSTYNSAGYENLNYAAPRMFGVRVKYRFGS